MCNETLTETRITEYISKADNLSVKNYSIDHTKPCQELNIYKKNDLKSTFMKIMNPKKSNIIVGSICKHHSMDLPDFKYPKN